MKALVLILYKENGVNKRVSLALNNGNTITLGIDELQEVVSLNKVILSNAYMTRSGQIRHKHNTKPFVIKSITPVRKNSSINLELYRNSKIYDGNTRKFGVTIKGVDYIAKFPKRTGDYSTICEHVASTFINNLGYSAHRTKLCVYNNEVVVLMQDFTSRDYQLRSFKDTGQSSEDTDLQDKHYTYEDVLYLIDKHTKIDIRFKKEAKLYFWRMYILDAILANRDRHHGNWGYLDSQSGYRFAPIYDNGACLFPDVGIKLDSYIKNREQFLIERAEKFPASLLMRYSEEEHRYKRTNYYAVLGSIKCEEMKQAIEEFKAISEDTVRSAIVSAVSSELIPPLCKRFYVDIVMLRYLHIVHRVPLNEAVRRVLYAT